LKRALIGIVVLTALAGGATYVAGRTPAAGPVYLTAAVERGNVKNTVTATGTVKAVVTVQVGSQLSGQIDKLFVDFNDEVRRGEPIAQLDQSIFLAKLQEAEAALEAAKTSVAVQQAAVERSRSNLATAQAQVNVLQAKTARAATTLAEVQRNLDRTQALSSKGVASERQLDQARAARDAAAAGQREAAAEDAVHAQEIKTAAADLKKAEAELSNAQAVVMQKAAELTQARVELARTVIRSPIDGVVIGRKVDRGQTVAASLKAPTLFTIAQDLRQMDVHARIDEADIGRIRVGQRASFTVDAFPQRHFAGRVVEIRRAPEVVKNVVTYTVVFAAPNPERLLLPGMTALVDIVVSEKDGVLKVPDAALRFRLPVRGSDGEAADVAVAPDVPGAEARIWLLGRDGRPSPVQVRLGLSDATATAIAAGPLRAGQKVVVGTAAAPDHRGPFGLRLGF
jgi:HlyD family secretion protein